MPAAKPRRSGNHFNAVPMHVPKTHPIARPPMIAETFSTESECASELITQEAAAQSDSHFYEGHEAGHTCTHTKIARRISGRRSRSHRPRQERVCPQAGRPVRNYVLYSFGCAGQC